MRSFKILPAVVAGAVLAGSGAFAQSTPTTPAPDAIQNAPAEKMDKQPAGAGAGASTSTETGAQLTQDLVGKDVVTAQGETVGEIEAIENDNVIVSVGGFLGIGSRNVALSGSQVSVTGTGDNAKVTTTLTKEAIKDLPAYSADTSADPASPQPAPAPAKPMGGEGGSDGPGGAGTGGGAGGGAGNGAN